MVCQPIPPTRIPDGPQFMIRAESELSAVTLKWAPQWSDAFNAGHGRVQVAESFITVRMGFQRSMVPAVKFPPNRLHAMSIRVV